MTTSSSKEGETLPFMMNQPESSERGRAADNDVNLLGNPTTLLVFNYLNDHGAQVYTNERNEFAILVNDQGETQSHSKAVYVSDQGDHYMDARGFKFLKTNRPNELNQWGNLVKGSRATSEPPLAPEKAASRVAFDRTSRPMPAPSAPPLVHPYRNNAPSPSAATSPYLPGHLSPRPIASTYGKAILTSLPVTRVYNDQNTSVLYENAQKDLYVMPLLPNGFYPPTVAMNVYESQGGRSFEYIDDWTNVYTKATSDDVKYLTWHGIPIEKRHMGNLPYVGSTAPFNPVPKPNMPGQVRHANQNTYFPPMDDDAINNLGGSMSHLGFGNNGIPSHRGATNPIPSRPTGFYGPHTPRMGDSQPGYRAPRPNASASVPFARAYTPRIVENTPALDVQNNMFGPNAYRNPRIGRWKKKEVRPSHLQRLCKAFDGSGDPYDHVARFRQVLHAEEVDEVHTMVQGFGLTLEGKALRWFQSLGNSMLYDFEVLIAAFIKENTKTGIKHNTLTQILDFKQREKETVKDAIARLKSLISRCPLREMPAEDRLISCFLEGLTDRSLHMQLIGQKHIRLDDCFDDALLYEDNCNLGRVGLSNDNVTESSHASGQVNQEAIADLVMKKMRLEGKMNPMQRGGGYPRAYVCGICSGNHPTGSCQREGNAHASGLIWCDICKKYSTHNADNCYYRVRALNHNLQLQQQHQQRVANPSVGGNNERAVPVLGTQPPLPGAAAVRYVDVASQELGSGRDLVPIGTYYEEEYDFQGYHSDFKEEESRQLMMVGQRHNGYGRGLPIARGQESSNQVLGPCFKCGSLDHWAKDCPRDQGNHWPRVERFCAECHIEHLSKDCPKKPNPAMKGPSTSSMNLVEVIPSSSASTNEEVTSLHVITRAQARCENPMEIDQSPKIISKRKKRKRRNLRKSSATSQEGIFEGSKEPKLPKPKHTDDETSLSSQDKGEHNQNILEGPPPKFTLRPPPFEPSLGPINENPAQADIEDQQGNQPQIVLDSEDGNASEMNGDLNPRKLLDNETIPPLDGKWATQLWEEVREKMKSDDREAKPPLSSIAPSREWGNNENEIMSVHSDWEQKSDATNRDFALGTLPSYLGEYEVKSEIVPITIPNVSSDKNEMDTMNLQALMSAPVTCTIPLADLLKIRPNLWENVAGLSKVGKICKEHNIEPKSVNENNITKKPPIPIHKVSFEHKERVDGNTTLPIEFNECKAIAILDTGAGVSIATKSLWEKWGRLALRKTRMQL
ncbi:hypothetical protein L7F22_000287 [Adiantum nelumboides]|nr:hypothetical protein [Adiantum nelumboides]